MPRIRISPDPILRKKARGLAPGEIKAASTKKLLAEMAAALEKAENGIGLAAPQIGAAKAIFIVLKEIANQKAPNEAKHADGEKISKKEILVFINPRIIKHSKKTEMMNEGCLSVPGIYGNIKRCRQVTLEAIDENGSKVIRGAGGLLAQVFQHECDHLNGRLFIDSAIDLKKHDK